MSSNYLDNPAGRLRELLTGVSQSPNTETNAAAWLRVFGLTEDETAELFRRIAIVQTLPEKIEDAVARLDPNGAVDPAMLLDWQAPVKATLRGCLNLSTPLGNYIGNYDRAADLSLQMCSSVLHRDINREQLPDDTAVQSIREALLNLREALAAEPNLDPTLRRFLFERVFAMEQALADMRFSGVEALTQELDRTVGAAHRRRDVTVKAKDSRVWRLFVDMVAVAGAALQVTIGFAQLEAAKETPALPPGSTSTTSIVTVINNDDRPDAPTDLPQGHR